MYKYSFKGHCAKNREKAFDEVEEIIKNHGTIVAFSNSSNSSMNLMVEVEEKKVETLICYLEEYMNLSDLQKTEPISEKDCKVLINLIFSN